MAENDFSTVAMIAGERPDIGIVASSTPTGKRGTFYQMCKNPSWGYAEFWHPSMDNPNWNKQMEDQFRAELTQSQYEHEILAEFGTEEKREMLRLFETEVKIDGKRQTFSNAMRIYVRSVVNALSDNNPDEILFYTI